MNTKRALSGQLTRVRKKIVLLYEYNDEIEFHTSERSQHQTQQEDLYLYRT